MTLNVVIALILRFFLLNSTDFQADDITVVEDRPIISVKYCLPVPVLFLQTWHSVVIKAERDWHGVGRPRVAMHSQLPRFLVTYYLRYCNKLQMLLN